MNFPSVFIPYLNFVILGFVLICMLMGYKKGFLYQIFSLLAILAAILVSWFFAPTVSSQIDIFPRLWSPFQDTPFAEVFYQKINSLSWYAILFFAALLVCLIVKPFAKSLTELPVLKQANHLLGALVSLVYSAVVLVLLTYFMCTPLIHNGQEVLAGSCLQEVKNVTENTLTLLKGAYSTDAAIQKLVSNPRELTTEDLKLLSQWLLNENNGDTTAIDEFLKEHSGN